MAPSKDAATYWTLVNAAMHETCKSVAPLWADERAATLEAVEASRKEAISLLEVERGEIEKMSHKEAIAALLTRHNIIGRIAQASGISDNGLFAL